MFLSDNFTRLLLVIAHGMLQCTVLAPMYWSIMIYIDISWINSLGPSDTRWRQRTESTLAQVMACCLTAPSHYLSQCWLVVSKFLWHLYDGTTLRKSEETNQWNKIKKNTFLKSHPDLPGANELKKKWHSSQPTVGQMDCSRARQRKHWTIKLLAICMVKVPVWWILHACGHWHIKTDKNDWNFLQLIFSRSFSSMKTALFWWNFFEIHSPGSNE